MAENPVLEHLRAIRATLEKVERDLGDVRHRVGSIERHLANTQSDIAKAETTRPNISPVPGVGGTVIVPARHGPLRTPRPPPGP